MKKIVILTIIIAAVAMGCRSFGNRAEKEVKKAIVGEWDLVSDETIGKLIVDSIETVTDADGITLVVTCHLPGATVPLQYRVSKKVIASVIPYLFLAVGKVL